MLLGIDRPTEILEKVFAAMLVLVSPYPPNEMECSWMALRDWVAALKGAKNFLTNLLSFNPLVVLSRNVEACVGFLTAENLTQIQLQRFSPALVAIHQWVIAVCEQRRESSTAALRRARNLRVILIANGSDGYNVVEALASEYRLLHLNMDHLLEEAAARGDVRVVGENTPDQVVFEILQLALKSQHATFHGWVLEGYPNNEKQMQFLEELFLAPQLVISVGNLASNLQQRMQLLKSSTYRSVELKLQVEDLPETCSNSIIELVEPTKPKRTVFSLLAPPTCGRREQAEGLASQLLLQRICVGDLLRREVDAVTEIGEKVKSTIAAGGLVDDSVIIGLLKNQLQNLEAGQGTRGVLLDGCPRTVAQAKALKDLGFHADVLLVMDVLTVVSEERAAQQNVPVDTHRARLAAHEANFESVCSEFNPSTILRVNGSEASISTFNRLLTAAESYFPLHHPPHSIDNYKLEQANNFGNEYAAAEWTSSLTASQEK